MVAREETVLLYHKWVEMHASTKWLIGEIAITVVVLTLLGITNYAPLFPYNVHKVLHIFGAVIFLGNIIVTGVWMFLAERAQEAVTLRFASKVVNWADVLFTAPGILLLLANGLILATTWGGILGVSWITVALALFASSGVVWAVFLIPDQNRLIRLSANAQAGETLPKQFFQVLHRWYFWGGVATVLPLISLGLMVIKPRFW